MGTIRLRQHEGASTLNPTEVYDTFWRFAAERLRVYRSRLSGHMGPWTDDPILLAHRFTNVYRASDRVSQHLIRDVQYGDGRSQAPDEVFFRTMLFKLFNRIETWELLEARLGRLSWQSVDLDGVVSVLDDASARGARIYSAAYIMPSPALGHVRKHANHVALLARMMEDRLAARLQRMSSLSTVYRTLLAYPGLGPFLAFQYAIDLNYSSLLDFDEGGFVVAGPGALDGISKCFADANSLSAESVIGEMVDRQHSEFKRLGLTFEGLFGRPLQPIDVQNLFCEISKYARVKYPHISGSSGRTRIKQSYRPSTLVLARPVFPPRWRLEVPVQVTLPQLVQCEFAL